MSTEIQTEPISTIIGGFRFYALIKDSSLVDFGITRKHNTFPIPSVTDTMKVLLTHWNEAEEFLTTVRSKLSE